MTKPVTPLILHTELWPELFCNLFSSWSVFFHFWVTSKLRWRRWIIKQTFIISIWLDNKAAIFQPRHLIRSFEGGWWDHSFSFFRPDSRTKEAQQRWWPGGCSEGKGERTIEKNKAEIERRCACEWVREWDCVSVNARVWARAREQLTERERETEKEKTLFSDAGPQFFNAQVDVSSPRVRLWRTRTTAARTPKLSKACWTCGPWQWRA